VLRYKTLVLTVALWLSTIRVSSDSRLCFVLESLLLACFFWALLDRLICSASATVVCFVGVSDFVLFCVGKMNDPVFVSVFDRFSGPVVSLKTYGQYNNQTLKPEGIKEECGDVWDVTKFLKENEKETSSQSSSKAYSTSFRLKAQKKKIRKTTDPIKHLYRTYIPKAVSYKIDCHHRASQNTPSHSHVINLIEHVIDTNDALLFRSRMNLLKFTCALDDEVKDKSGSYPKKAPYFVDHVIGVKYNGKFVIKTPLWDIQHCLSMNNPSRK